MVTLNAEETAILRRALNRAPAEATSPADQFLLKAMADGPVPAADVLSQAQAEGFSEGAISRSRRRLGILSRRIGFGPGSYVEWSLPEEVPSV